MTLSLFNYTRTHEHTNINRVFDCGKFWTVIDDRNLLRINASSLRYIWDRFKCIIYFAYKTWVWKCQLFVVRHGFQSYRIWSFALTIFDANNFSLKISETQNIRTKLQTVGIVHDCYLINGIAQISGNLPNFDIRCSVTSRTKQINLIIYCDWAYWQTPPIQIPFPHSISKHKSRLQVAPP